MRQCYQCGSNISDNAKFCNYCGAKFGISNKIFMAIVLVFTIFCAAFCAALIVNYNFEKKYLRPYEYQLQDKSFINVSYNKRDKQMQIIYTDVDIKQWQKDYIKHFNIKEADLIKLNIDVKGLTETLIPEDVDFNVGEPFKVIFYKNNCSVKDYININKYFPNRNKFEILAVVDPSIDVRQKAKLYYQSEINKKNKNFTKNISNYNMYYLIKNDLETYKNGGDSMYGRLLVLISNCKLNCEYLYEIKNNFLNASNNLSNWKYIRVPDNIYSELNAEIKDIILFNNEIYKNK